jgi:thymidylate synthase (FAD)
MKWIKPSMRIEQLPQRTALNDLEYMGRVCYKSEDRVTADSASKFVAARVKQGHWSVIEHLSATVRFIADRGFTHELVRHRLASYSQESTRYCDYGKDEHVKFIDPRVYLIISDRSFREIEYAYKKAEAAYFALRNQNISPQFARMVLPIGLKTEIVATANFREWAHIFQLRASEKAHPLMQYLIRAVQVIFQERFPEIFGELDA